MSKKVLDLFCGQGGAAKGYQKLGLEVTGVDIANHGKRYPGEFIQADAIEYLAKYGHLYDIIHASPPCQGYSIATAGNLAARAKYPLLIAATRELMQKTDAMWVIENVEQARSQMIDPILLCGRMFGLQTEDVDGELLVLDRHRLFESNVDLVAPKHPKHGDEQVAGVYGGSRRSSKPDATAADDRYAARYERKGGYVPRSKEVKQKLLGIDWMTVNGMYESIPPAYSEYVGKLLLAA